MAWPHCVRILNHTLDGATGKVSRIRGFAELRKISTASQGLFQHDDCNGGALTSRGGRRYLHPSFIESEPSAAVGTPNAASPGVEGLEETIDATSSGREAVQRECLVRMDNTRDLYSGVTSKELVAALLNLQLVSFEPIVDLTMKIFKSRLMNLPVTSVPILWLVKRTAYSHFCGGENSLEVSRTLGRMSELGLQGILDYSLEDAEDNESCDENCAGFLDMISQTRSFPDASVSSACLKISAIGPIGLLQRVSDHLRWEHKSPGYKLTWKQDGLPILARESPTYQTRVEPEPLTSEEERDLLKVHERLMQLCKACAEEDLPILIDAEDSSIQPAIDYLTYSAAFEFNKGRRSIVYGTIQAYLKDAQPRLSLALAEASKRNVSLALKLVRGAYMAKETSIATSLGIPSPVHDCISDTHECYHLCASVLLNHVAAGNSAVIIATHNSDSGKFAARRADELGLDKTDKRVQFAQLQGMADGLSLGLGNAGFNVSKYIPVGPVAHVIPYLARRAEENRGLLGNSLAERRLLRTELWRRLRTAGS